MRLKNFTIFVVLAFWLTSAMILAAQTLTVRNAHSLVYDSNKNKVLLFGGADEKQVYGDLWVLKKKGWKRLNDNDIEPRTFASLVYDEANKRVILFGGNKVLFGSEENPAKFFNDTWEFKKGKWRKIELETSPEQRAEAAIAYDKLNNRIILFGGYTLENGKLKRFGDTWEFSGNKWRKLSDKDISPRNGAALAFDSNLDRIVLFGGSTENKDYGEKTGETWVLEGDEWKKLEIDQPANIFNSNMIFDEKNKQLFRFGGWNGSGRINETWIFKNKSWEKLNLKTNPPARNHASMVYDPKSNKIILFGGHDGEKIFGDLWIFEKRKWYKRFEHSPIKRLDNGH
jgi:hypothetical protein